MARSIKKDWFVEPKLMAKVQSQKERGQNRPIKTWYRRCAIHPDFVGHTFNVHNGKSFLPVFVTENMVGHKLGEFSPTRVFKGHSAHVKREVK